MKNFQGNRTGDIPSLRFGREMEAPARELFINVTDFELLEVGLVIKDKHCWLAASPDGIIWSKRRPGHGILEIKMCDQVSPRSIQPP